MLEVWPLVKVRRGAVSWTERQSAWVAWMRKSTWVSSMNWPAMPRAGAAPRIASDQSEAGARIEDSPLESCVTPIGLHRSGLGMPELRLVSAAPVGPGGGAEAIRFGRPFVKKSPVVTLGFPAARTARTWSLLALKYTSMS